VAEVQQDTQYHDTQTALQETQRKLAEKEAELEQWQTWNAEQTRLQSVQTQTAQYD